MVETKILTLQDGRKITCGLKEFEDMQDAIKKQDPKLIAIATAKVMMSSDEMKKDLVVEARKLLDSKSGQK